MSKRKRIGRMALCLIISFVMVMTLIPRMPASMAYAEDINTETADAQTVADDEQVIADEDPAISDEEEVKTETPVDTETDQQEVSVEENSPEQETPAEKPAEKPKNAAVEETAAQEKKPDEAKDEKSDSRPLFAEGKHFRATVTYGPEAGIPEGAKLVITEFAEGSKAYEEAKDALVADKRGNSVYSLSSEEEQENYGMAAFDLTIYAADGSVVEPDSDVTVNIEVIALPKGADADVLADTMEIQHLNESTGDVVVEKVATVDSAEAAADKSVGEIAVDTAEKTAEAEFGVEGFSTFTLTWGEAPNTQSATIHYGTYVDGVFTEFSSEHVANLDTTAGSVSLANVFDGYTYFGAYYVAPGSTEHIDLADENIYKTSTGWEMVQLLHNDDDTTSTLRAAVANGGDIYACYAEPTGSQTTPSGEEIPTPVAEKEVTVNEDGTATITLDVTGTSVSETQQTGANVLVVMDRTYSMRSGMGGGRNRWQVSQSAVSALVEALDCDVNDIDLALVTFYRIGEYRTINGETWTKDGEAFDTLVQSINANSNTSQTGTNWESGLYYALQTLGSRDGDDTYVIFLTDGEPNRRGTTTYTQANTATAISYALTQAQAITALSNVHLYGIFCGADSGYNNLANMISNAGGVQTINGTNEEAIHNAFQDIASTIVSNLGANNVSLDDGVPKLSGVSANVTGAAGGYKYYYNTHDPEEWVEWEGAPGASYSEDNGVTWDLSRVGSLPAGTTYRIQFNVWPSQEAYDLIANLNNGLVDYDELDDDIKAQIDEHAGNPPTYTLKTNTHYNMSYSFKGNSYTDPITDYEPGDLPLVSHEMNVQKAWDDSINPRNRTDKVDFYLLVDGLYYQNDGSFASTKTNAYKLETEADEWTDSVKIAPGFAEVENGELVVYETGHKYVLEEIPSEDPDYKGYSQDFTSQTVRPMVIGGQLTYLVLVDEHYPAPSGAQTYNIVDESGDEPVTETYYVQEVANGANGTLTGTNHKTPELDITKKIDASETDMTEDQLNDEEFTYEVVFTVPEGGDVTGINYWIYEQDSDGWTLPEYDSDGAGADYAPYGHTDGATYSGEKTELGFTSDTAELKARVTIKRGQVLRFTNLPTGTTYKIVEVNANGKALNDEGYTVSEIKSVNGTASTTTTENDTIEGEAEAFNTRYYNQFENLLRVYDVTVTKTFSGIGESDIPSGFAITPTFGEGDDAVVQDNLTIAGATKTEGKLEYTWTLEDVPYGTVVSVDEGDTAQVDGYRLTKTTPNPVTVDASGKNLSLLNEYVRIVADVTVTKTFNGIEEGDIPRGFAITPTFGEGEAAEDQTNLTIAGATKTEGKLEYTWTLEDVPVGTVVSVDEGNTADITGYTLAKTIPEAITVSAEGENVLNVVNAYSINTYDVTVTKTFEGIPEDKVPSGFTITPSYDGTAQTALAISGAEHETGTLVYTWTLEDVPYGTVVSATESGTNVTGYTLGEATTPEAITVTGSGQSLDFVNPYTLNTYNVTVTKTFEGIPEDKVPSGFTITPSYDGTAQTALTISGAEHETGTLVYTWTLEDVPHGTVVSATESGTNVTGYTLGEATTPEAITVTGSGQSLDFVNPYTLNTYDVTVTKTFEGIPEDKVPSGFTITPSYDGTAQTALAISGAEHETGTLVYTWTLEGVPHGTVVSATESGTNVTGYTLGEATTPEAITVTGSGQSLDFVNPYTLNTYDVTVKKTFEGIEERQVPSDFTITPTFGEGEAAEEQTPLTISGAEHTSGTLVYTWTLEDVPHGTVISVEEDGTDVLGYLLTNPTIPEAVTVDGPNKVIELVNPYEINLGDLKITKELSSFAETEGQTTFSYSVKAMLDGEKVYDDVVSIDFTKAGTDSVLIAEKIPVGSRVTVEEIYTSGSYEADGETVWTGEIGPKTDEEGTALDPAEAKFKNKYNNNLNQGYGILNEYTNDGTGWNHKSN